MDYNNQQTAPASSSVPSTPSSAAGIWAAVGPYPPCYRFVPKDEELIKDYLQKKINNEPISISQIHDVNLYDHHPQHLAENYTQLGEKEWYFFTPRDRRYPNGKRPRRTITGAGHWRASGADKNIVFDGEVIGKKRALSFYSGPGKTNKTSWLMYEYQLNKPSRCSAGNDVRLDDWVLCRIYQKRQKDEIVDGDGDDDISKYIAPLLYADDNNEQAPLLDANINEQDQSTLYIPDNNEQQYNHAGPMINSIEDNGYQLPAACQDSFNDQVLPNNSMEVGPSQMNLPNFDFGKSFDDFQFWNEQEALCTSQQQDFWDWAMQIENQYGSSFQQDSSDINVGATKISDGEQLAPKKKKKIEG
ncbi:hypothetical protein DH2020_027909 [Rehmannia glutinosa]|uniref:NAC domain-containing protein n=1 Tax=Rehmannia glutinosa TaxID=99300 RepID=A0ABR0VWW9_REHGL